jgi:hypothetical protein
MDQSNTNTPTDSILTNTDDIYNSTASILYFLIVTIIYFVLRFFFSSSYMILTILYFLLVVAGEFGINLSISKKVCGTNQYVTAGVYTVMPWTFMFGLLQGMLTLFPGWLTPFSNTIGYLFVKIVGIGRLFNNLLLPKTNSNAKISEALEHIYNDRSLLINEISQENFENFWTNMNSAGLFKPGTAYLKDKLFSYIKIKNIVAECVWYILTGLLIISVSFNLMINSECDRSIDDIMKNSAAISNEQFKDVKKTVYKVTE